MIRSAGNPNVAAAAIAVVLFAGVFLAQGVVLIRGNAPTFDEATHVTAGFLHLSRSSIRIQPENPPLVQSLMALPTFAGWELITGNPQRPAVPSGPDGFPHEFLYASPQSAEQILGAARTMNLLLGTTLVLLTAWFAYRLWGGAAAAVALALSAMEPTLVAHASLATTDIGASLFFLLTLYLLWEHSRTGSVWAAGGAGLAVGLALVAKYSGVIVLPIVGVLLALYGAGTWRGTLPASLPNLTRRFEHSAALLLVVGTPAAFVVLAVHGFQGFGPWWSGLQQFLYLGRLGQPGFFLGEHSSDGWPSYFPVAFLIKTSLGTLLLLALSLALPRAGAPLRRRELLFLVVPVAVFFAAMTTARVNIGVRHVLPAYPLLFILASRTATFAPRPAWPMRTAVAAALIVSAVSAYRIAPHQLAYFNEIVGGAEHGHEYLSDSNLDWGQDLKRLKQFLEERGNPVIYLSYFGTAPPEYYGIRYQYVPGSWPLTWPPASASVPAGLSPTLFVVSAAHRQELLTPYTPLFEWLEGREPIARIGYSLYVYDLSADPDAHRHLSEAYRTMGLDAMADAEASKAGGG